MNFKYVPEADRSLRTAIARNPNATLHEIRRAHPFHRTMSLDQLAIRLERMSKREELVSLKSPPGAWSRQDDQR